MAGDGVVGRIAYLRETGVAKVGTVVGPSPRTLRVAYYDDAMLTNRDGAFEDNGMSRNFEGECFGGHRRRPGHLERYSEKEDKRKISRFRSLLNDSLPSGTAGRPWKVAGWMSVGRWCARRRMLDYSWFPYTHSST